VFSDDELRALDPLADQIIKLEQLRQDEKLIMIPSESICPAAVRAAVGSPFSNIYAEGYPSSTMEAEDEAALADLGFQLAHYRRYNDRRYYQGCQYADLVESLARRRLAELFARTGADGEPVVAPEQIFTNVQPLSGAAANNAVYEALLQPGDTIMGMELNQGGHLTHGSSLNRSGKYFHAVPYGIDIKTGRIDYAKLEKTAYEANPRIIVAGASAYPWDIDWKTLRRIADSVGALLLADISHPAGLVVAGLCANPIGYADVITLTTHKTMLGPRGAVILTIKEDFATRIDRAVFPGEQGGPHINTIAGMAACFRYAQTDEFRGLQARIVENAKALAAALTQRGMKLVYGGTETHLLLIDLKQVPTPNGMPAMGEIGSRILELCGLVCNKNTIPGDKDSSVASGLRFGTVWLTQRGMGPAEMNQIAGMIHRVLTNIHAFIYAGTLGILSRGKIDLPIMEEVRAQVRKLVQRFTPEERAAELTNISEITAAALQIRGARAGLFLQGVCTNDMLGMCVGESRETLLADRTGKTIAQACVTHATPDMLGRDRYILRLSQGNIDKIYTWLDALADGYVLFDEEIRRKIEGPVVIEKLAETDAPQSIPDKSDELVVLNKPYFIGQQALRKKTKVAALKEFTWSSAEAAPRSSCLYEEHLQHASKQNIVPFAGWLMPVVFSSIAEEHAAVRQTAALFDVSHMGVFEIAGPGVCRLLDIVSTEYVPALRPGQGKYGYILDPNGNAIDDIFLFCRAPEKYMLVANAANADHVFAWINAVNNGEYIIDRARPDVTPDARATIRDLKDPAVGADMRVDLALQGPASLAILRDVIEDARLYHAVARLHRSDLVEGTVQGMPVLISRTGYTGQETGYELYVHPDDARKWWHLLQEKGAPHGLKITGLGARDSARTEAGLPLFGHELGGPHLITPTEAGYASFVKLHKPFFIGRDPYLARLEKSTHHIIRFQMTQERIPVVRPGSPLVDARGVFVGTVTSCAVVAGRQIGMAYVERRISEPGTLLAAFILPPEGRALPVEKSKNTLATGDRVTLPYPAEVLPRFMTQ
jgi:glycine hydroxymethyltransferase